MRGTIIRGIGGFYYTEFQNDVYECKAAGKIRLSSITPRVGDQVEIEFQNDGSGYILEIHERKNQLIRPTVANVDMLVFVLAKNPKPDYLMSDKILIDAAACGIETMICVNKCDLPHSEMIARQYISAGYNVDYVSSLTNDGIASFAEKLHGIVCFAGQSGVGKSSLLNCLLSRESMETAGISKKIERGKHTTREVRLLRLNEKTCLVDTPGFSVVDLKLEPEQLKAFYPEFVCSKPCRFDNCIHSKEEDCGVKDAVLNGRISTIRYENYLKILEELQLARRNKYD
ncbi:MAG: ribosome small subunit-dependent GTPase A [Christensenellales bacterium]